MKHLAITVALVLSTTTASAQDTGFYAGLLAGTDLNSSHTGGSGNGDLADNSPRGIFAGYQWTANAATLGVEIAHHTHTAEDSAGLGSSRWDLIDVNDLKFRAATDLGGATIYGFVGYSSAKWADFGAIPEGINGLNFGVGVQADLTDRFFAGVELIQRNLSGTVESGSVNLDMTNREAVARVGFNF